MPNWSQIRGGVDQAPVEEHGGDVAGAACLERAAAGE